MNRNFIVALILLVTFSMVNAIPMFHKRETTFTACPADQVPPGTVPLTVTINPDPPVPATNDSFTVSGKLTVEITDSFVFAFNFADASGSLLADPFKVPICTGSKCPIPANTDVKTTVDVPIPKTLPDVFISAVLAGDDATNEVHGCAVHLPPSSGADSIFYTSF